MDQVTTKDIYLTSEERFQVWQVKIAERRELVDVYQDHHRQQERAKDVNEHGDEDNDSIYTAAMATATKVKQEEEDDDDHDDSMPPLTDGCDLPAWRRKQITDSTTTEVYFNVGVGCHLLRRESQLPVLSTRHQNAWIALRDSLSCQPKIHPRRYPRTIAAADPAVMMENPWFERQNVPVIIDGITDDWKAMQTFRWDALRKQFGHYEWRVSDTHAEGLTLDTFTKYSQSLEGQVDDAPLALYDSQFHLDERVSLVRDYTVPKCFANDLYALLEKEEDDHIDDTATDGSNYGSNVEEPISRPPFRWILIGGARSGTGLHVDPVGTHAWVTLIQGTKRWVLFPPHVDRADIGMRSPQIPSSIWFRDHYHHAMTRYSREAIHVVQKPGQTVYVPAGWPHIVLNLEASVAVTENYATPFPSMTRLWQAVEMEAPPLAKALRLALTKYRPELLLYESEAMVDMNDGEEKKVDTSLSEMRI